MRRFFVGRFGMTPITVVFFVGLAIYDQSGMSAATLLAAAWHEMGHLMAAWLMRIPVLGFRFDLLGARIDVDNTSISYGQEWLLAAAGPMASLVGAVLMVPLWEVASFFQMLSAASLLLGILNLLPIRTFDGGRMAETLLMRFFGVRRAWAILRVCTLLCLFLLWMGAVYLLLRVGGGLSLLCFSVSLLGRFFESEEFR